MQKTKKSRFRLQGYCCFIPAMVFFASHAFSQTVNSQVDSSGNIFGTHTNEYALATGNVQFPEILKGNEAASVDYIEKFSERRRDYIIRMHSKGKKLLPKAAGILKKYKLPEELKVLMILESAYNANAVSKAGAVGYWQFMDAVAKEYGLKYVPREIETETVLVKKTIKKRGRKIVVEKKSTIKKDITFSKAKGKLVDDRKNFNKATVAAARYLRDRRLNLDDNWLLVVASYNCGVGNVWEAMEKSNKPSPTFWDIKKYLPEETQTYVMNFITLNVVYHNYDNFLKRNLVFRDEIMDVPGDNPVPSVIGALSAVSIR